MKVPSVRVKKLRGKPNTSNTINLWELYESHYIIFLDSAILLVHNPFVSGLLI